MPALARSLTVTIPILALLMICPWSLEKVVNKIT
jgi:hypothetical protein